MDTLIFSYIRRLGLFGAQSFEFQYFWGFQKNNIMDNLGVIAKLDYFVGSFLCILGSIFTAKVQNRNTF